MNEVYGNGNYVRDSIACSRSFQEVFGAQQGITGYGNLVVNLIAVYTEQLIGCWSDLASILHIEVP